MPAYNAAHPPQLVTGASVKVFNAETPTPGNGTTAASQQVGLMAIQAGPASLFFHGQFSGAPGTFEVDCQVAAVDVDTNYQTLANGNITTVDATNQTFHLETISNAPFARMLVRSRTNSVSISGWIGR